MSTNGDEGRGLQWSDDRWRASDHATLSPRDISALRARYRIPEELLSDDQIVITNPKVLALLSGDYA